MFFREKKNAPLGCTQDTKKERTLLRALVFESRGRKERQSRFHRAHTWSSTTRPRPTSRDSVVRIIPVVCFRRIIFAHVCMCVVRIIMRFKKRRFFGLFLGKKSSKIHSSCDERKNEQSFPRPTSPRGKNNKKRNDVSLLFSPQSRKPRAR